MSLYTTTLDDIYSEISSDLTTIFNNIPSFDFSYTKNGSTTTVSFNFQDMFYNRYKNLEIGQETEKLFIDAVKQTTQFVLNKYLIQLVKANEIYDKVGTMNERIEYYEDNIGDENDADVTTTDLQYLNPIASQSDKVQGKNVNVIDSDALRKYYKEHDGKVSIDETVGDMIKELDMIKDYYNKIIDEYRDCFMLIY